MFRWAGLTGANFLTPFALGLKQGKGRLSPPPTTLENIAAMNNPLPNSENHFWAGPCKLKEHSLYNTRVLWSLGSDSPMSGAVAFNVQSHAGIGICLTHGTCAPDAFNCWHVQCKFPSSPRGTEAYMKLPQSSSGCTLLWLRFPMGKTLTFQNSTGLALPSAVKHPLFCLQKHRFCVLLFQNPRGALPVFSFFLK